MKKFLFLILLISIAVTLYFRTFSNFKEQTFCLTISPSINGNLQKFDKIKSLSSKIEECTSNIKFVKGTIFSDPKNNFLAPFDDRYRLAELKRKIDSFFDIILSTPDDSVIVDNLPLNSKYLYKKKLSSSLEEAPYTLTASLVYPIKKSTFIQEDIDKYIEQQTDSPDNNNTFSVIFADSKNSSLFSNGIINTLYAPDILIMKSKTNSYEIKNDKTIILNFNDSLNDLAVIKIDLIVKNDTEITILRRKVEFISF